MLNWPVTRLVCGLAWGSVSLLNEKTREFLRRNSAASARSISLNRPQELYPEEAELNLDRSRVNTNASPLDGTVLWNFK